MVLSPAVFQSFAEIPDFLEIRGRHIHFWFVVVLTPDELLFRSLYGAEALLEQFKNTRRSPVNALLANQRRKIGFGLIV